MDKYDRPLQFVFDTLATTKKDFNEQHIVYVLYDFKKASNLLQSYGIKTYQDLKDFGREKILKIEGIGQRSYRDIARTLDIELEEYNHIEEYVNYRRKLLEKVKECKSDQSLSKDEYQKLVTNLNECLELFMVWRLTPPEQEVFKYVLHENYKPDKIAIILNIPVDRVKKYLITALDFLMNRAEEIVTLERSLNYYYKALYELPNEVLLSTLNALRKNTIHKCVIETTFR